MDADLVSSATKFGGNVSGEKFGIAAGNIHVGVAIVEQLIQHGNKILEHLHFIEEDVVHAVVLHFFGKISEKDIRITILLVAEPVQFQTDDMIGTDPGIKKILPEQFKKQI